MKIAVGKSKRKTPLFGGVVVIALIAFLLPLLLRKSFQDHANTLAGCLERNDVGCIRSYVSRDELDSMGLGEGDVDRLFNRYFAPRLARLKFSGHPTKDMATSRQNVYFDKAVVREGKPATIGIELAVTDEAVRAPTLLSSLILELGMFEVPPLSAENGTKLDRFRLLVQRERGDLESLGVRGIRGYDGRDSLKFQTWDDLVARFDRVSAKIAGSVQPQ